MIKTTDGGQTWTLANSGIDFSVNLTDIQFTSINTGYVTGLSDYLYKTIDGGNTWTSTYGGGGQLKGIFFTSHTTGYSIGNHSGHGIVKEINDSGDT